MDIQYPLNRNMGWALLSEGNEQLRCDCEFGWLGLVVVVFHT